MDQRYFFASDELQQPIELYWRLPAKYIEVLYLCAKHLKLGRQRTQVRINICDGN